MSTTEPQPSEEELRAAYEAEIKKIRVEHVLLEHVVTLVNLGMRRTGLAPGTEAERDPAQVELAIESIRSVLPLLERFAPQQVGPIRDALSQLQLAFVQIGGQAAATGRGEQSGRAEGAGGGDEGAGGGDAEGAGGGEAEGAGSGDADAAGRGDADAVPGGPANDPPAPKPGEPGPAESSGRLWVPGQ